MFQKIKNGFSKSYNRTVGFACKSKASRVAIVATSAAIVTTAASRADGTDPIAAVTTQFTTLAGNASTLGIALIGVVAAIAVIALAIGFLRKGHH